MIQNSDGTLQINRIATKSSISNKQILESIKEALPRDSFTKTVLALRDEHPSFELEDGLLYFEGLIYILTRVRELVI
jgi:hypothetical protein